MFRNWSKGSLVLFSFFSILARGQQTDTLRTFEVSESLSKLKSFSSIEYTFDSLSSQSMDELLEQSPIYLKNYGQGQLATLSIRGNGASQTQVFWNGFKINSPTLGQTDLSLLPTFFLNSATLNYSGASSVNGSGGIGGSLDLENKLFWKKGVSANYGKQIGSFSNSTSTIGVSFGGKKVVQHIKLLTKKGENDFEFQDLSQRGNPEVSQRNNSLFQFGGQYEIGAKLNKKNLVQANVLYFNSQRELPPIIGAVSNNEVQHDNSLRSFISWKSFQQKYMTDVRFSYFNEELNYVDSISSIFSEVDVDTYQGQVRSTFKLWRSFDLETSIQNSFSRVNSSGFIEKISRKEAGLYVKISEKLSKLYYEVFGRQELIDKDFLPFVFGGGLVVKPFQSKLKLRGNISSNYRVPTLNDLYWDQGGNESLLPEKGWTSEIGFDYELAKPSKSKENKKESLWNAAVIGFYNQTEDWIQWTPTSFGYWTPRNVKQINNAGVEARAAYSRITSTCNINASVFYSYTHSKNNSFSEQNEDRVGKIPIYIPSHKANATITLKREHLCFVYTQIYNGRVFIDETNVTYLPHYFPANCGISYFNKLKGVKYKVGVRVINLFDEPYQVVANRPIPGRNYSLSLSLAL